LECGTFWSCKGLEASTVVVLLPGCAPRNPTYVALTRATHRLIVMLDPREPHAAVSRAVAKDPEAYDISATAGAALSHGCESEAPAFERRVFAATPLRCLDNFAPRPRVVEKFAALEPQGEETAAKEVAPVTVRMGLVAAEYAATGVVRAMEDVLHPTRLEYGNVEDAIRAGLAGRIVPLFVRDDALLAPDLRALATRAYRSMATLRDMATVALAVQAWDAFDHVMRASQPVQAPPDAEEVVAYVKSVLPIDAAFDVRLVGADCHVRVQATNRSACYHVVSEATSSDVAAAAVRAALHPRRRCVLVDVATQRVTHVTAAPQLLE
jgi:hypothetical protein